MSNAKHAKYSPSQLHRIIACPGSVIMSEGIEQLPTSPYAAEGTMLHSYMEQFIETGKLPDVRSDYKVLLEQCMDYLTTVRGGDPNSAIFTELYMISAIETDVAGTADVVLFNYTDKAHIIDWKFGGGVHVAVLDNPQFLAYAWLLMQKFPTINQVTVHVAQPRLDNFDYQTLTRDYVSDWYKSTLSPALRMAERTDNPVLNPSLDACRWCRANAVCPARRAQVDQQASEAFALYADIETQYVGQTRITSQHVDSARIAEFYEMIPSLENAIKAVKDYVRTQCYLKGAEAIPGYKVVQGRGSRKWAVSTERVINFMEKKGVDAGDLFESDIKSVAAIEKLVKGLKTDPEFNKLYQTEYGAASVVSSSDPRPAVSLTRDATNVFASVADTEE